MGKKEMKKSRSEIDGKEFGEKLFDENFQINFADSKYSLSRSEINKYRKLFNDIRRNTTIKEQWESLWQWRSISNEEDRIKFFRYQCLLRNKEVQDIRERFINEKNVSGFDKYAEQNWFMPFQQMYIFERLLDNYYKGAEYTSDGDLMGQKYPSVVTEIFEGDPELIIEYNDESAKFTEKTIPCDTPTKSDRANWDYDFGVVKSDKYFREPTMYLRIDLRHSNEVLIPIINALINEKREKHEIAKIGKVGKAMEMALMIYDMKLLPLSDDNIRRFMQWTVNYDCSLSYIKEKLRRAKELIRYSTKRDFPPKTTANN